MAHQCFLGIDASLRSLGLCVVPSDWGGDFDRVSSTALGIKLADDATAKDRIEGMIALASDVRRYAKNLGVTHVCFEDSLPSKTFAVSAKLLTKLIGYIERELAKIGLYAEPVNQSSARSYFLGALPKGDRKKVTLRAVDELTDVFHYGDEKDAFVTVNRFMSAFPGVFTYSKPKPVKAKRARNVAPEQRSLGGIAQ
jgi:hypothetical protein